MIVETSGVFHVADVGLPAADDKKVVPLNAAKELATYRIEPSQDDMIFPFSSLPQSAGCH